MNDPKLHHYVPQFYLRRFADAQGTLWVWDRAADRTFRARPRAIAAETHFYHHDQLEAGGHDPLAMERQFADLEGDAAQITGELLDKIRRGERGSPLAISEEDRRLLGLFIVLQFLRTADAREVLALFVEETCRTELSERERRSLHLDLLWDEELVEALASRVSGSAWIFGKNTCTTPFVASDNPVAFRTADNRMWLKAKITTPGTYVVYPLAPDAVMYCFPDEAPWCGDAIKKFDGRISPVEFTTSLVESENSGQTFMASSFLVSNRPAFDFERNFATSIGTDRYAPKLN